MSEVYLAQPAHSESMGSLGRASMMLIRQDRFPHFYDESLDKLTGADHDRVRDYHGDKFREACQKHMKTGDQGIGHWAKSAHAKDVRAFIIDALQADTSIKWTGWRILGTVNRATGYAVYTLELFAKHPESKTKVYSHENAPNVQGYNEGRLPSSEYDPFDIMGRPIRRTWMHGYDILDDPDAPARQRKLKKKLDDIKDRVAGEKQ